jgi:CO/xanthine dehydrogenase FAD-binding subunit
MLGFAYHSPTTTQEAATLLVSNDDNARPMAGGTDLLVQLNSGRAKFSAVVDLKRVPGAIGVGENGSCFIVGAATSAAQIGEHDGICRAWPGLVEAVKLIGSTQIQSRASLGGNLCNASPAADTVPAMIAAEAICDIVGPNGRRIVPVESFLLGPGRTCLKAGEYVLTIRIPKRPRNSADAYLRSIPRTEMDIAIAGAAVSVTLDTKGIIGAARVALGAVAPTAILVPEAGAAILGTKLDADSLDALEEAVRRATQPISDKRGTIDYRVKVAGTLARRASLRAYQRAEGQP